MYGEDAWTIQKEVSRGRLSHKVDGAILPMVIVDMEFPKKKKE